MIPQKKLAKRYRGQSNLQTGNRVYKGVSNSPHSGGGLNKTGYIDRDRNAANKKNILKSQLKSGGRF